MNSGALKYAVLGLLLMVVGAPGATFAETNELRLGHQLGLGYLQFYIMHDLKLVEKYAKAEGLNDLKVTYKEIGSPSILNDTILSGRLDMVSAGPPPFMNLWDRTRNNLDVRMLVALNMQPMKLNTNNPKWKTACEFSTRDRIAVPGVKTSTHAILLSMLAEKCFGPAKRSFFDGLEVPMKHPDAVIALTSGKSVISGHFATIPYQSIELRDPTVHTVVTSYDLMGGPSTVTGVWLSGKFYKDNPKTVHAAFQAFEEATEIIKKDPKRSARIYLKLDKSTPLNQQQVEKILTDPDVIYSVTPQKMMVWAKTMYSLGLLKHEPKSWKDFFFPMAYDLAGN
ncbi:MAG TPA: ABC transporter substrate-binding protein [Burkholderiales bacterium]|nr:ABC transporter substrate-binding protein [Burkholderiales bacterium]